jgi:hypothetical protein
MTKDTDAHPHFLGSRSLREGCQMLGWDAMAAPKSLACGGNDSVRSTGPEGSQNRHVTCVGAIGASMTKTANDVTSANWPSSLG